MYYCTLKPVILDSKIYQNVTVQKLIISKTSLFNVLYKMFRDTFFAFSVYKTKAITPWSYDFL